MTSLDTLLHVVKAAPRGNKNAAGPHQRLEVGALVNHPKYGMGVVTHSHDLGMTKGEPTVSVDYNNPVQKMLGPAPTKEKNLRPIALGSRVSVSDIPKGYSFLSDSQDTEALKGDVGGHSKFYDSFFVGDTSTGEYKHVYGMNGIVPGLEKQAYRIR